MMELTVFWVTIFLLGMAHALEPGHGKLLVTSYLTGSQARMQDAFVLGLLAAVFHTLSVGMLGALVVYLAFTFFETTFVTSLEMISGAVILGLGLLLFWRRFLRRDKAVEHCDCHILHSPDVASEEAVRPQSSMKEVVLLGLASGMTPCPMALAAMIAAFAMGHFLSALGALVVFSLGIGAVLVVLGVVLIQGAGRLQTRFERFRQAPVMIAKFSTIVILLLGCYLLTKPLFFEPEGHEEPAEALNFMMPELPSR